MLRHSLENKYPSRGGGFVGNALASHASNTTGVEWDSETTKILEHKVCTREQIEESMVLAKNPAFVPN